MFDALHQLWSQYTPLIILDDEQEDDVPPKKAKDNIRSWLSPMIKSFNNLLDQDSDFFHHYYQFEHSDRARLFWLGSAIRPSGALDVDFTEQGLKRISSWIMLITLLQHSILKYKKVYGNNLPFDLDNFLELIEEQDDDFCRNFSLLKDKICSTSKSNKGSMTLVAQYTTNLQLDEDYVTVSEESVNEYNIRLNHVWNLLRQ